jgi:hypothetical protein
MAKIVGYSMKNQNKISLNFTFFFLKLNRVIRKLTVSLHETIFQIYVFENWNFAYPTPGKQPYFLDQWGLPMNHSYAPAIIDEL